MSTLFDSAKGGYWFTFVLFEFFLFYIFVQYFLKLFGRYSEKLCFPLALLIGVALYVIGRPTIITQLVSPDSSVFGLLSMAYWSYFLFFVIGALVKKHFGKFEWMLDKTPLVLLSIVVFLGFNVIQPIIRGISNTMFELATTLTGLVVVFAFFRSNQKIFSKQHIIGKGLQFIGRRTLDIYLLHYFIVYSNMQNVLPNFGELNTPFVEFLCSLILGGCVIAGCLGISQVIRLSPKLAHFLFGAKIRL